MKMKAKLRSRSTGIMPTSNYLENMTTHVVNIFILFLCISNHNTVFGQRVLWLYVLPQSNYLKLDQQSSPGSIETIQHNGVSSDSREATSRVSFFPVPSFSQDNYFSRSEPIIFQRSSNFALNKPHNARNYGYGSASKIGQEWYAPFYNSKSNTRSYESSMFEGDSAEESALPNQNILMEPKITLIGTGNNVDEDIKSNESGSSEISIRGASMEDFSPYATVPADEMSFVPPFAIFNKRPDLSRRCSQESNIDRFHPETGTCYTVGTKGPCGNYMIFVASDDFNGYCDCDQGSFDRPLILIGDQCQFLYTQATCLPGYWLTLSTPNSKPGCQPNPCYHLNMADKSYQSYHHTKKPKSLAKLVTSTKNDLVLFKGECVHLNSSSRHCRREEEVVLFPEGRTEPACGIPKSMKRIVRRQVSRVPRFRCGRGTSWNRNAQKCKPIVHFKFNPYRF